MKIPRGIRNNNPLNIRVGASWKGLRPEQTDKEFCQFTSMVYGLRAAHKLLRNYITGFDGHRRPADTLEQIINKWAPPKENKTSEYLAFVCRSTGLHPRERVHYLDRKIMCDIVSAMANVECGQAIDRSLIESAFDML